MGDIAIFLLFLFVTICSHGSAFSCGANKSHNAIFGSRNPGDELLFLDHPKLQSSVFRVVSYDVVFPIKNEPRTEITYVEALDQFTDGDGGCAGIVEGGVGSDYVRMHLKSKRGYGLDFIVRIYGLRKWIG